MFREYLEPVNAGEQELKDFFRKNGLTVKDVSDNANYWDKDIDMIATNPKTGNTASIEVKWDSKICMTNNIFVEVYSDISKRKKGWFKFCQADLLYYGDSINKKYYIFNFNKFKKYIEENKDNFKVGYANDYNRYGERIKTSSGYLVPLDQIEHLIIDTLYIQ